MKFNSKSIIRNKFQASDLEVFVVTYNRADYLRETLASIASQTLKGCRITILDNASTDKTPEVVESFKAHGMIYSRASHNGGGMANFMRAQSLASTAYAMVLHDDDVIHPQYLERALQGLNRFPDVALITSCSTRFQSGEAYVKSGRLDGQLREKYFVFKENSSAFSASLLLPSSASAISGAITRSELLKRMDLAKIHEDFGKNMDWPYMIKMASKGTAVILEDSASLHYRIHKGQDSNNDQTGVTIDQFLNFGRLFYAEIGADAKGRYYKLYNRRISGVLLHNYNNFLAPSERGKKPFRDHIERLYAEGFFSAPALCYSRRKDSILARVRSLKIRFVRNPCLKDMLCDLNSCT